MVMIVVAPPRSASRMSARWIGAERPVAGALTLSDRAGANSELDVTGFGSMRGERRISITLLLTLLSSRVWLSRRRSSMPRTTSYSPEMKRLTSAAWRSVRAEQSGFGGQRVSLEASVKISHMTGSRYRYTSSTSRRKSGKPAGLEIPAPQRKRTSPRACANNRRSGIAGKSGAREIVRPASPKGLESIRSCTGGSVVCEVSFNSFPPCPPRPLSASQSELREDNREPCAHKEIGT